MTDSDTKGLHLTELAYVISGGLVAFTVSPSATWYLHFPFYAVAALLAIGATTELLILKFILKRTIPTFTVISLTSGMLLISISIILRTPFHLPDERIRIAVTTFGPGSASEDFTNRLLFTLKRAQEQGLPIEVVEVGTSVVGTADREKEAFAVRIGKSLPISAHMVVWGRIVTDAPPYYASANVTLANNPFEHHHSGYRDAPWLEFASIEGIYHPRLWPRTSSHADSAAQLESLLSNQSLFLREFVEFISGLVLLETRQYRSAKEVLPLKPKSFNLRYLRAIASLEESIEVMSSWFIDNDDFILHAPMPDDVKSPLERSIAELDTLLLPVGIEAAREANGLTWYAYYTRARAKQMLVFSRGVVTGDELRDLRDTYRLLAEAANRNGDKVAEARAFLEFGGLQLWAADSTSRPQIAAQLFSRVNKVIADQSALPLEVTAMAYLRRGDLCADSEWSPPNECAVESYQSALTLFRSLSAPLGEAAVHSALARMYSRQPSKAALGRAVSHYVMAIDANSKSRYANVGIRAKDAWFYLGSLAAFHDGNIPLDLTESVYNYIMKNTYHSKELRLRGAGDLLLQDALTQMKIRICRERAPKKECWEKVVEHTNALLNGFIGLDDARIARYRTLRSSALWELSRLQSHSGLAREAYIEFLVAISSNNKAGGDSEALFVIVDAYKRMERSTNNSETIDAEIIALVRKECIASGSSFVILPQDSFAHRLYITTPRDSVTFPARCARTSFADKFEPLKYSMPVWSGHQLGLSSSP